MGSSALAPTQHHTMLSLIIFTLVAAASAAPQIVPYAHEEIPAEPYVHQEIEALPYVHEEPALTPEALGNVAYSAPWWPLGTLLDLSWPEPWPEPGMEPASTTSAPSCPAGSDRRGRGRVPAGIGLRLEILPTVTTNINK